MPLEVIERIRAARVAGDSLRRIADSWSADAVPIVQGGTRWYASTVKAVLDSTNEAPSLAGCGRPSAEGSVVECVATVTNRLQTIERGITWMSTLGSR